MCTAGKKLGVILSAFRLKKIELSQFKLSGKVFDESVHDMKRKTNLYKK